MPIAVLPQTLINQIAAGEVVVRMASVAKELVENSIDAEATRIEIHVRNDARDLEIRDDGCGMDSDDAELCLQRHATSKIRTVEDLFALRTRGFRGEALPSIASVSRLEIQTRQRGTDVGTRVVVEGGRILRIEPFGCPPGTRMIVRDLFYNTPARLKFLKSSVGETNAILGTITRQALAQPQIGFHVGRNDKEALELPPGQSLRDRYQSIAGDAVTRDPFLVSFERDGTRIHGVMAHPEDAKGDRRGQFLFVNDRPFSSRTLSAAWEQACRGFIMAGRHAAGCLFIEVPPEVVDFNVHPTKEEVRFQDERTIAGAIFRAIEQTLQGGEGRFVGTAVLTPEQTASDARPAPNLPAFFTSPEALVQRAFERKQATLAGQVDWVAHGAPYRPPAPATAAGPLLRQRDGTPISAGPGEVPDDAFWRRADEPEVLGQLATTYVLARYGSDLLLIDQHAAHERLVYLKLKRQQGAFDRQALLVPIMIEVSPEQASHLDAQRGLLSQLGFDVEEFGPRSWAIRAVPTDLKSADPVPLLLELLDDFADDRQINALADFRDRVLIRTACHGSIRGGTELSVRKMAELLEDIRAERLSFTCPHGRPTIVRLSKDELDRMFRRVL